jgi:hypothetical protein
MKNINAMKKLYYMAVLLAVVSGCSTKPVQVESNLGIKGAPDWVNKGAGVLDTKEGRFFRGVGSASPMGDLALQKAVADDRARAEVARVLSSYLDVVSHDYTSAVKSGEAADKNAGVNEEAVSRQIKNTTKAHMAGTRIIGSWRDPQSNTIWSIAELDMKYVKSTMAGVSDMNSDLKRYIETTADNIFDRFSKEKN